MKRMIVLLAAWALCGVAATAFAQGVQTGTIRGVVKDQQGLATPGVTVTVTSPALQGPRSVVTDTQLWLDLGVESRCTTTSSVTSTCAISGTRR